MAERKLFSHALLGYRIWLLKSNGRLAPAIRQCAPWSGGTQYRECICKKYQHTIDQCRCGFHAYHSLQLALDEADKLIDFHNHAEVYFNRLYIAGAVLARGDVQLYYSGFRAEAILPIALLNNATGQPAIQQFSKSYSIPLFDDAKALQDYALQYGQTASLKCRPDEPFTAQQLRHLHSAKGLDDWMKRASFARAIGAAEEDVSEFMQVNAK